MFRFIAVIMLFFLPTIAYAGSSCDKSTAKIVAHVYMLSNPFFPQDGFIDYIKKNKSHFTKDSSVLKCAEVLGRRLISTGINGYDTQQIQQSIQNSSPSMSLQLGNSIESGAIDTFEIGQELLWLVKVLPQAANENYTPFLTTGTPQRMQLIKMIPILNDVDPDFINIIRDSQSQFGPMIENQIYILAISM